MVRALQGERTFDITGQHGWPPHWCKYSPTYYFFTNICDHAFTDNGYQEVARGLFRQFIGTDPAENLDFGIGTPESVVAYDSLEVKKFIVELLNMPSAYYFVAREGRVSILPVTEHGSFFASGFSKNSTADPSSAVITTALSRVSPMIQTMVLEFEDLLNQKTTKEQDIQRFLSDNPGILLALDDRYCEIKAHVCLYDASKERLIPDFMIRLQDSNIWHAIELKLPHHAVTVRSGDDVRLSAKAARGIAELLTYRDFFGQHANRVRVSDRFGAAPYEPCLILVIGRGRSTQKYEWQNVKGAFQGLRSFLMITFLNVLSSAMRPSTLESSELFLETQSPLQSFSPAFTFLSKNSIREKSLAASRFAFWSGWYTSHCVVCRMRSGDSRF